MRHGSNERVRQAAAQALLDRGWAEVAVDGNASFTEALRLINEKITKSKTST